MIYTITVKGEASPLPPPVDRTLTWDQGCVQRTEAVADPGVDPHGAKEPPFGLDLVLRSTDDMLNGTTLSG